jgi:Flp pilus assembly protein TadB
MRSPANSQNIEFTSTIKVASKALKLVESRIWLPKTLYDSLPWFYLIAGAASLAATLYIGAWYWVLPHYLLFSAACLNLSLIIFRRRRPAEKEIKEPLI